MKKLDNKKKLITYSGIGMLVIASASPLLLSTFNNTNSTYLQKEAQEKTKDEDASSINDIGIILTSCLTVIALSIFVTWLVLFIKKQTSFKTKTFKYK